MPINKVINTATTAVENTTQTVVTTATAVANGIVTAVDGIGNIIRNAQSGLTNAGRDLLSGAVGIVENSVQNSIPNFTGPVATALRQGTPRVPIDRSPPMRNILHNYASYNYIITMFIVSPESYNFAKYRNGDEGSIILKTGSGSPENRVQTEYGKFDFYIDDLELVGVCAGTPETGNASNCTASFKIIEPYSMGLFMQSLVVASQENGYQNYFDAPVIIKIEFKGHLNVEDQGVHADALSIEKTTRYLCFHLGNMDMKVTHRGAEYTFSGAAVNELAMASTYSEGKTDFSIEGSTVHEILQTGKRSLQRVINDKFEKIAIDAGVEPDKIIIYFPTDMSFGPDTMMTDGQDQATVDPAASSGANSVEEALKVSIGENETLVQQESDINVIGTSSMGFDFLRPADQPFAKDNDAYDPETQVVDRSKVNIQPNVGVLRFSQGMNIQHIINQVILISDYCKNALKPEQVTEDGKIPYWRINSQVFYLNPSANIEKKGVSPKLIVYRITPYFRDAAPLLPTNADNPHAEHIAKNILKEYDYIYTGKNLDVLNFDIHFAPGFYRPLYADLSQHGEGVVTQQQLANAAEEEFSVNETPPEGTAPSENNMPSPIMYDKIQSSTANRGGTARDTPSTIAARQMHDILFNSSSEMAKLELTILGDPYYIGDSGVGNYYAKESEYHEMNADHGINHQSTDIRISLTFRTPIDLDPSIGAYNFGSTKMVNKFSGIYVVSVVTSKFSKGRFSQILTGYRQPGQTMFDGESSGGGDSSSVPQLIVSPEFKTVPNMFTDTAKRYNTTPGSQQTQQLADQDSWFND
jgi:hypothetical protein